MTHKVILCVALIVTTHYKKEQYSFTRIGVSFKRTRADKCLDFWHANSLLVMGMQLAFDESIIQTTRLQRCDKLRTWFLDFIGSTVSRLPPQVIIKICMADSTIATAFG